MKNFGILFKTLRKKVALTQKELADKLGIDSTNISKWERDKNLPDISILPQIASALNVSCEDLLHPTETLQKMTEMSDANTSLVCDDTDVDLCNNPESEFSPAPTTIPQKRRMFTPKRILLACMLIVVLAICICVYVYTHAEFTFVEALTNVESQYGPAYELVYHHPIKLPEEVYLKHAEKLAESWKDGEYVDCTEKVLIVSYFLSLEDVDNLNNVFFRCCYLNNPVQ